MGSNIHPPNTDLNAVYGIRRMYFLFIWSLGSALLKAYDVLNFHWFWVVEVDAWHFIYYTVINRLYYP